MGLAQFRTGDTAEKLLARADAALYVAKEGGRNQVHRAA
jgi:PleD family two-component response regulator